MFSTDQSHLRRYLTTLGVAIAAGTLSLAGLFLNLQQDMLVTKSTLARVTPTARSALLERQRYLAIGTSILPYFILAGCLGGLSLAAYGLIGWAHRQKVTDELEDLALKKGQVELRQMTDQEQAEKLDREAGQSAEDLARASAPHNEEAVAEVKEQLLPEIRNRQMILNASLTQKLRSALGPDNVQINIRASASGSTSRVTVDAIARLDDLNFVFELKYVVSQSTFFKRLNDALRQVDAGVRAVAESGTHNVRGVVIFVVPDSVDSSLELRLAAEADQATSRLRVSHRVLVTSYGEFLSLSPEELVISLFRRNGPSSSE